MREIHRRDLRNRGWPRASDSSSVLQSATSRHPRATSFGAHLAQMPAGGRPQPRPTVLRGRVRAAPPSSTSTADPLVRARMRTSGPGSATMHESPAGVAQLAEQPSCKRQVSGSIPLTGSTRSSPRLRGHGQQAEPAEHPDHRLDRRSHRETDAQPHRYLQRLDGDHPRSSLGEPDHARGLRRRDTRHAGHSPAR